MIGDFPVTGTGLNTFGTHFMRYRTFNYTLDYLRSAHCDYLQLVSEMGAAGAIFLVGFFITFFTAMRRVVRRLR